MKILPDDNGNDSLALGVIISIDLSLPNVMTTQAQAFQNKNTGFLVKRADLRNRPIAGTN